MPYFTSEDDPVLAPYGTWRSPITSDLVAQGAQPLSQSRFGFGPDGAPRVYCLQGRPSEGGRVALLRWDGGSDKPVEAPPAPWNVRTRVHEYGGGSYLVCTEGVVFSHFADNRLYLQREGQEPVAISQGGHERLADFIHDPARARLLAVREVHGASGEPVNSLCALPLPGAAEDQPENDGAPRHDDAGALAGPTSSATVTLASGHDFYSSPRLSPDGTQLAWMTWDHPRMPWEGSELWLAELDEHGMPGEPQKIAGGPKEAICQPEWSPDGVLYFVSDRTGWWNLYRYRFDPTARAEAVCKMSAEFGVPHWNFGQSRYAFNGPDEIVCAYIDMGTSYLGRIDLATGTMNSLDSKHCAHYTDVQDLHVQDGVLLLIAGAPTIPLELARVDLATGEARVLARTIAKLPEPGYLSVPESIDFASSGGRTAHAFFYRPANRGFVGNTRAVPPLLVISHGGPTSMASSTLSLNIQYWTSRGFAVLDVNYGGSSGFGRAYRDSLRGRWGIIDVDDCVNGARFLAEHGMVDGTRLIVRGGSAGGYTTLCALTFHDVFKVGASYYGVSDLKALDQDSHKFEAHYNEYLIAPKLDADAVYAQRSPIHHANQIKRPVIFFQGLDDKVVPPAQSETMVAALKDAGIPVSYLTFEGEGHGFRRAATIARTLDAELYFYATILGMTPPSGVQAPEIMNLHDNA
ncbi:MAG TPA: S9 family peptidase [Burkholderiaceae bacterium]